MAPREATNPFPDQFLTLDYEHAGPILLQHEAGPPPPPPLNGVDVDDQSAAVAAVDDVDGGGGATPQHEPTASMDDDAVGADENALGENESGDPHASIISNDPLGNEADHPSLPTPGSHPFATTADSYPYGYTGAGSGAIYSPAGSTTAVLQTSSSLLAPAAMPGSGGGNDADDGNGSSHNGAGNRRRVSDPLSIDPTPEWHHHHHPHATPSPSPPPVTPSSPRHSISPQGRHFFPPDVNGPLNDTDVHGGSTEGNFSGGNHPHQHQPPQGAFYHQHHHHGAAPPPHHHGASTPHGAGGASPYHHRTPDQQRPAVISRTSSVASSSGGTNGGATSPPLSAGSVSSQPASPFLTPPQSEAGPASATVGPFGTFLGHQLHGHHPLFGGVGGGLSPGPPIVVGANPIPIATRLTSSTADSSTSQTASLSSGYYATTPSASVMSAGQPHRHQGSGAVTPSPEQQQQQHRRRYHHHPDDDDDDDEEDDHDVLDDDAVSSGRRRFRTYSSVLNQHCSVEESDDEDEDDEEEEDDEDDDDCGFHRHSSHHHKFLHQDGAVPGLDTTLDTTLDSTALTHHLHGEDEEDDDDDDQDDDQDQQDQEEIDNDQGNDEDEPQSLTRRSSSHESTSGNSSGGGGGGSFLNRFGLVRRGSGILSKRSTSEALAQQQQQQPPQQQEVTPDASGEDANNNNAGGAGYSSSVASSSSSSSSEDQVGVDNQHINGGLGQTHTPHRHHIHHNPAFDMDSPSAAAQQPRRRSTMESTMTNDAPLPPPIPQVSSPMGPPNHVHRHAGVSGGYPHHHLHNYPVTTVGSDATPPHHHHPPPPHQHPYPGAGRASTHPPHPPMALSFGPATSVSDLKYFAERGLVVACLAALHTPRLQTLGARMLADYAKMPNRRVAVASNRRILEFVQRTVLDLGQMSGQVHGHMHVTTGPTTTTGTGGGADNDDDEEQSSPDWLGREYAVETVRSLTATEESDRYLMGSPGLLRTLALVARGGPFVHRPCTTPKEDGSQTSSSTSSTELVGLASPKARLHACIAVMNLSCGKGNKVQIASVPEVLEAMRDVMMGLHFPTPPNHPTAGGVGGNTSNAAHEARLKATTCVKNLSNADANDAALLACPGLVEALGTVAEQTCDPVTGATPCTTNACLALMNLSISKGNKHRVFRTKGVMEALMAVITRTSPRDHHRSAATEGGEPQENGGGGEGGGGNDQPRPEHNRANAEARVKACSALSNLAIGYDNKIPMFGYAGFVDAILEVIHTDGGEARTKACSILWSFAAEMKNQVPVVQRGDILPTLVAVAAEDGTTEARFKCVAALTLLAESLENAIPLLQSGALAPLMDILHDAGPDPTQWKGQTASWCVGFLMNIAQSDEAVPTLRQEGVVELLAPLLTLDHYQSLKAAMAVTFVCRYDEGDETYDLLRKTENVIPKIISLLHNTLSGRGGNGYKYGVFTLRSSVGCIASLASGPDFMKERIATGPVYESLLRVVADFCVDGGTPGAIVGGGRDDTLSATLAVRALQSLTGHLIPIPGSSAMPFGAAMDDRLVTALHAFELCTHPDIKDETRRLATDARIRIQGGEHLQAAKKNRSSGDVLVSTGSDQPDTIIDDVGNIAATLASNCCGLHTLGLHALPETNEDYLLPSQPANSAGEDEGMDIVEVDDSESSSGSLDGQNPDEAVRTFLLSDSQTGRRFAVPTDPTGGRSFNDNRVWCYRRGRFCRAGEVPDPNFRWSDELQAAYVDALAGQRSVSSATSSPSSVRGNGAVSPVSSSASGQQQ